MSSRTSEARQKAALAKLRLSQAKRASQLEQETMEEERQLEQQTKEAERQLEQQAVEANRHLEQKKMEQERQLEQKKMELNVGLEKEKAKIQAKKKLRGIADEVEQCELEVRLIEGENAEDEPVTNQNANTTRQQIPSPRMVQRVLREIPGTLNGPSLLMTTQSVQQGGWMTTTSLT